MFTSSPKFRVGRYRAVAVAAATAAVALSVMATSAAPAAAATSPQPAAGQVAGLSTDASGTLSVFYQAADHTLALTTYAKGVWSAPVSLGGRLTSGPAAVTLGPPNEVTYVYVRGTDNAIWYRQRSGGGPWSPWASLGGKALGAPTVSSGAPTHYNLAPVVWVRGTDGALWQNSSMSSTSWYSLGGRLISDPAASPSVDGNYNFGLAVIAVLGTDHAVWAYKETDAPSGGTGWYRIGGRSNVAPAISGWGTIFARGTDKALWLTEWNPFGTPPAAGAWQRAGGALTSAPTATTYPAQAAYAVALGTDGNLWQGVPPPTGSRWIWTQIP